MIPTLLLIRVSPISDSYTLYFLSCSHPSHVSPVFLFYRAPRFLLHTVIFLSDSSLFRSSSQITMIDPRFSRWSLTSRALTLVDYGKHHEPDIYGWWNSRCMRCSIADLIQLNRTRPRIPSTRFSSRPDAINTTALVLGILHPRFDIEVKSNTGFVYFQSENSQRPLRFTVLFNIYLLYICWKERIV